MTQGCGCLIVTLMLQSHCTDQGNSEDYTWLLVALIAVVLSQSHCIDQGNSEREGLLDGHAEHSVAIPLY